MTKKRYTSEKIIHKLREAEVELGASKTARSEGGEAVGRQNERRKRSDSRLLFVDQLPAEVRTFDFDLLHLAEWARQDVAI